MKKEKTGVDYEYGEFAKLKEAIMSRLLSVIPALIVFSAQAQTITQTFGSGTNQFGIDFVTIGNPGNAADTAGSPNPAGSVSYIYNIGKYEISRDMITKANSLAGLGVTLYDMESPLQWGNGNGPDKPATGISFNEAARFVNFLNTSKGYSAAYTFDSAGYVQKWQIS